MDKSAHKFIELSCHLALYSLFHFICTYQESNIKFEVNIKIKSKYKFDNTIKEHKTSLLL